MASLADQPMRARFEMLEQIGQGGFARVFRAREVATGRMVALKVLKESYLTDKEIVERFRREAFAIASISSPHVVALHDFGISGKEIFLAMEYVVGPTLRQVMYERPWTAQEVHLIVGQIAQALSVAHQQNIVHRDLKPENVMLVEGPDKARRVKVLDFGLAKLHELERDLGLEQLTRAGMCFGTPQYMSPEQIRGKVVDQSGDLYALGIITFEMLSGYLPWDGPDSVEVMQAVIKEPVPTIGKMHASVTRGKEMNRFLQRALAKDKKDRPGSAAQFFEAFEIAMFGARQPAKAGADRADNEFASVFAASIAIESKGDDETVVELEPPAGAAHDDSGVTTAIAAPRREPLLSQWVPQLDSADLVQTNSSTNGYDIAQVTVPMHKLSDHPQTDPLPKIEAPSAGGIPRWVFALVAGTAIVAAVLGYLLGRMPRP